MSPTDQSPELLAAAVHEAGHALAFRKARVRVHSLQVWLKDGDAEGLCRVDDSHIPDRLAFLAAILAGAEAHARFVAQHHGMVFLANARRAVAGCASDDHALFQHYAHGVSHGRALSRARSFVWWNSGPITRLGHKLARTGRLSGWSL
ncbi:hypothetical protein [Actinopolyspora mortivallis]|uniref:Peptidase M41 domain-containing protein n=1 Tax=Actinopolyspora mortivallis TaxID=33906 RepID=A0A2T0GV93_ACTMO|nr:hypothetical protein [Actinopolyspora mortivallis]PRW63029.1 hypothetical protein CEP50_12655 [Actinopolyspora mortivallis]